MLSDNGEQALAYVRSRHYTEIKEDGKPHEDPTADLGRIQRQQVFLRTVMSKVAGSDNPIALLRAGGEIADGMRVDDQLGLWGAMQLAWAMKGLNPESVVLPVAVNSDHATLHLITGPAFAIRESPFDARHVLFPDFAAPQLLANRFGLGLRLPNKHHSTRESVKAITR